jgi:ethanolamine transporter EutH
LESSVREFIACGEMLNRLEPFGIATLAGGLLYSIGVLTIQSDHFKFHFIVLLAIVLVALLSITLFKYLKYRYACENMDDIIAAMKIE